MSFGHIHKPTTSFRATATDQAREEYIESELARRKRLAAAAAAQQQQQQQQDGDNSKGAQTGSVIPLKFDPTLPASGAPAESQRVLQGRLMEIDLGEEARARNAAMTERARKRLKGEDVQDEEETESQTKKVRLGPDGKPWRPRNRRGSDDIKRDQLVEEFLSENRGMFQPPHLQLMYQWLLTTVTVDFSLISNEEPVQGVGNEEEAADERIAADFRRQFMEAMSHRHRRRRPAVNARPTVKKRNDDEYLKGPKLGGSRNARAAIRDKLLQEQQMKKER